MEKAGGVWAVVWAVVVGGMICGVQDIAPPLCRTDLSHPTPHPTHRHPRHRSQGTMVQAVGWCFLAPLPIHTPSAIVWVLVALVV